VHSSTDQFYPDYRTLDEFNLFDLDIVRLSLTNENILAWSRLNATQKDADSLCDAHLLNMELASDIALIERIRDESVAYLQEEFEFPMPAPVQKATLQDLLAMAANQSSRHRQFCACTLLKAMHIINHFDAREARQALKLTDQELFKKAETRIYQTISAMMAQALPVVEFLGGRKQRASMVTKLLSKDDPLAAELFDKMRFRVVTATREDVIPTINFLSRTLFPFNYVLSGETYNTLVPFGEYVNAHPQFNELARHMELPKEEEDTAGSLAWNPHSSPTYQVVHWVADMPIRIDDYKNAYITDGVNPVPRPIIYIRAEIQILDRQTHRQNEQGHASHKQYKARQVESVLDKLKVRPSRPSD